MASASLEGFARAKLADLEARSLRRTLREDRRVDGLWVERDGKQLLSFSCNDYLNLSHHPEVKAAAIAAVERYGAGAGASRLVTGNHPLLIALEEKLARFKGVEAACVFGSGYLANAGIVPTLVGADDIVVVDELAHACLWAGARLSGAHVEKFRHNDADHLAELFMTQRDTHRHALVLTDGVFSMDGDLAPMNKLSTLCAAYDAWLMVDDAHGLGVLGNGRGTAGLFPDAHVDLQMGTLSKALGSYGGYVCASATVIDLIKTRARTHVYSTALPPASAAAAVAALGIIARQPDLAAKPLQNAQRFTAAAGLPAAASPIVPVILRAADAALSAARDLEAEGFLIAPIRPPTVPEGTARLRIAFTAGHPESEIDRLAGLVKSTPKRARRSVSAIFIAGAGTDIGKTYVACALIRALREAGTTPDALKPVVSGFDETAPAGSDPALLLDALGRTIHPQTLAQISPWRYTAPLAANMAARAEGKRLDFDAVLAHCQARIANSTDLLLIEGAGGVMSPLSDEHTFLDLMSALSLPSVLVAGSYLGAISHALTALEAIRARRLDVRALVLSESADSSVDFNETIQTLARLSTPTPVFALRRSEGNLDALATLLRAV